MEKRHTRDRFTARRHGRSHRWGYLPAALLLFLSAAPSSAGGLSVLVNGKSIHLDTPKGAQFNEANWGGGLQYDFRGRGRWYPFFTASGFEDSLENPSYYAGGGLMLRLLPPALRRHGLSMDAGLVGFLMVREDFNDKQPFPGVLPALTAGTSRLAVNVTFVPAVRTKMVPLWFFQLKLSLSEDHAHY